MTDETLTDMWQSNEDFHQRFLGRPANQFEALTAYDEECKELEKAVLNKEDKWATACEGGDAIYTVIGLLRSVGITEEMFLDAMQFVISKNNAKTHETHYINDKGKIQRKGRE